MTDQPKTHPSTDTQRPADIQKNAAQNPRERIARMHSFLERHGWGEARHYPIEGDASSRQYIRLEKNGVKAVLMNAPMEFPPAQPLQKAAPDTSPEARRKRGYGAMARLAGEHQAAFICLADALTQRGFSAPQIWAVDLDQGFILMEDLGATLYARVLEDDITLEPSIYEPAIDTLAALYRSSFPKTLQAHGHSWHVGDYDTMALLAETDLFLDWYMKDLGHEVTDIMRADWYGLWESAFTYLEAHAPGLCLRDFHAENIFWLPERKATARVGLIDFQDGLFVHPAYDLVSLLEDARRDVQADLHIPLMKHFCQQAGVSYDDEFITAYKVIAAQRHTKVIGFPIRADIMFGKPQYRALIPRVKADLNRSLTHPALHPIRAWTVKYVPELLS